MKPLAVFTLLCFTFIPGPVNAGLETSAPSGDSTNTVEWISSNPLYDRLDEIKAMDNAGTTPAERKLLRQEVRAIKSRLRQLDGRLYIRVGVVVMILLIPSFFDFTQE